MQSGNINKKRLEFSKMVYEKNEIPLFFFNLASKFIQLYKFTYYICIFELKNKFIN